MDEVFGDENFICLIQVQKTGGQSSELLANTVDFILWYAKDKSNVKYRQLYGERAIGHVSSMRYDYIELPDGSERRMTRLELTQETHAPEGEAFRYTSLISSGPSASDQTFKYRGREYLPAKGAHWKTTPTNLGRLDRAGRIKSTKTTITYKRYLNDFAVIPITDRWESMQIGTSLIYVVQTATSVVERCLLMATDPGDLVLDPTCGSGTTATVAEQWGRRWITIDTSRVSLALARSRIMGARYPFYLLADSEEGQQKEGEISRTVPSGRQTFGCVRHGFVYARVPHITLKAIANNTEVDVIWSRFQDDLESLRSQLNSIVQEDWEEWEIPGDTVESWPEKAKALHQQWRELRISRQREIDESIAAKADFEHLYDKPYEDKNIARVAGPFTVESLSPHRVLGVDENDELIDGSAEKALGHSDEADFVRIILESLKTAGVQQAHKEDKIAFSALTPWPGDLICAEGLYVEGGTAEDAPASGDEKRAAIFVGPEFGTVSRPDLVAAAREAGDAGFDVLIACAFNYDAHSSEFDKLGRVPVLKARMNADLHMADDLKNTGKGNLFVIFGEPDIDILDAGSDQIQVKVNGVDVFHPQTGEVRSDGPDGIACWFIDTDYNEEAFFVRQAYFLGANDPYKSLKTTLKAEIDEEAWASLNSDTSRPFKKPSSGRIAVKVINHLGDEVMKVFRAE